MESTVTLNSPERPFLSVQVISLAGAIQESADANIQADFYSVTVETKYFYDTDGTVNMLRA
jgi:hypothetical protein